MNRKKIFASKIRWTRTAFLMSGALNVIFLAIFSYFLLQKTPSTCALEYPPAPPRAEKISPTNLQILRKMAALTTPELVERLEDKREVEEGYKVRDLALSILVRRDHFDLSRGISRQNIPFRLLKVNSKTEIPLFPHLSESDFENFIAFVNSEKWPLTSKGLFLQLSQKKITNDPTLVQAFVMTPEFLNVEMLFKECKVKKKWLLGIILEGKWTRLSKFCHEQKSSLKLDPERRREFLTNYIRDGSQTAASLFLLQDFEFCLKKLSDQDVCKMLDILPQNSKHAALFASQLIKGMRSDAVLKKANSRIMAGRTHPGAKGNT